MTPTPQPTPDDRELAEKLSEYIYFELKFGLAPINAGVDTLTEAITATTSPLRTALEEAKRENEELKKRLKTGKLFPQV